MIEKLSSRWVDIQIGNGSIQEDDKELYRYGYQLLIGRAISVIIAQIMAGILGVFMETLVFMIVFIAVRQYAGGYHLKSTDKCIFFSTLLLVGAGVLSQYIALFSKNILFVLWTIAIIVILILAPVENDNKPLDESEKKVYRKRTYVVLFLEIIAAYSVSFTTWEWITSIIILAQIIVAINLMIGSLSIKNFFYR